MRSATVSVIIPTYNRVKYINEAIDSALAQTHAPSEIFIIDDGSTDHTKDVVLAYKDPRIHYVPIPHAGIAAARNTGLALASGDYVALLDSDDRWRHTMLEKQVAIMSDDASMVCSFTNFVRFRDHPPTFFGEHFTYYTEFAHMTDQMRQKNGGFVVDGDAFTTFVQFHEFPATTSCIAFRRALIADMRMNASLRIGEDTEFILRAFMRGKVALLPEVLAEIRRHDSNITNEVGELVEFDKVNALLCLRTVVGSGSRRHALNDRLVKGYIDGASALIRAGRRLDGIKAYLHALRTPGSSRRKLKGLVRVTFNTFASLTIPRRRYARRNRISNPN